MFIVSGYTVNGSVTVPALRANVMTSLSGSRDTTLSGNQGIVQFENLDNAA